MAAEAPHGAVEVHGRMARGWAQAALVSPSHHALVRFEGQPGMKGVSSGGVQARRTPPSAAQRDRFCRGQDVLHGGSWAQLPAPSPPFLHCLQVLRAPGHPWLPGPHPGCRPLRLLLPSPPALERPGSFPPRMTYVVSLKQLYGQPLKMQACARDGGWTCSWCASRLQGCYKP